MLSLKANYPNGVMPDFVTKSQKGSEVENFNMRATVEVYQKGSPERFYRNSEILSNSTIEMFLPPNDYSVLLWVDMTPKGIVTDHYYTTSSFKAMTFNKEKHYTASTDNKDALFYEFDVTVADSTTTEKSIPLERPFAKYRIIATDVGRYRLFEAINDYPPLEELIVTISYNSYLPNSFNITKNKPNNSTVGVKYDSSPYNVNENNATIGSDYIFVNDVGRSSVYTTITIADTKGKKIAQVSNVEIKYSRNHLTTISGDFLTAGVSSGGITINTDWDSVIEYEF